jgi:NAD(P)-dependent dehydrogenase (short-subunit alcohol dehydrogenase family)
MLDLSGKVALITGGSGGLGRHIAAAYAEHGADVIVASRKQDMCVDVADRLKADHGVKAWGVGVNVSRWDECDALVESAYAWQAESTSSSTTPASRRSTPRLPTSPKVCTTRLSQ